MYEYLNIKSVYNELQFVFDLLIKIRVLNFST